MKNITVPITIDTFSTSITTNIATVAAIATPVAAISGFTSLLSHYYNNTRHHDS